VVRTSKRPSPRPKRPAAKKKVAGPPLKENPAALKLARAIAQVALDKKAQDVLIIDTRLRGSAVGYDYIVLATGESDRQLGAISEALRETLKPQGHRATSVEASPDWVLVNYDDVVGHFFSPDTRSIYDLEGLWSDAPRVALQG
jgi:ribosome-associated protein